MSSKRLPGARRTDAAAPRAEGERRSGGAARGRVAAARAPARRRPDAHVATDDARSLSVAVRERIEEEILSGRLRPGAKLDEEALGKRFGASRTPVREGLKHLASAGLVELRPRLGAFVAQVSVTTLIEMFETMAMLESACASLAARRHTADDRKALQRAADECRRVAKLADPRRYYDANAALHECVYRACRNAFLEAQTLALRNRLEAYRRETTFHPGLMAISNEEHDRIVAAILAMDEEGAAREMRGHLDTLRNDAVATYEAMVRRAGA
jgi:DNA-binding GntR family transcriptional regulator